MSTQENNQDGSQPSSAPLCSASLLGLVVSEHSLGPIESLMLKEYRRKMRYVRLLAKTRQEIREALRLLKRLHTRKSVIKFEMKEAGL